MRKEKVPYNMSLKHQWESSMKGKRLVGEIVAIGTYNDRYFRLRVGPMLYKCLVENMEKWDLLYDYMNEQMLICTVTCDNVGPNNTITVRL